MKTSLRCSFFFFLPLFSFFSCTATPELKVFQDRILDPSLSLPNAEYLIRQLSAVNSELKTFKGIGTVDIAIGKDARLKERIAWIGEMPLKMQIVVLASGHPVVKIAGDGNRLYYHDLQKPGEPVRKALSRDPDLKRLIPISINISDLLSLLSGRMPLHDYHSVKLYRETESGYLVLVLRKWWRIAEKIYLRPRTLKPFQMEAFSSAGKLRYRAEMAETTAVDGYPIPKELVISNDNEAMLKISIDRFWVNVPVSPSMFAL